jgi:hypothetical protein
MTTRATATYAHATPHSPPHTPHASSSQQPHADIPSTHERYLKIMRLELEFLYFLDYDLTTADPAKLICWAHTFDTSQDDSDDEEADDEMDDDDDMDTCTLD